MKNLADEQQNLRTQLQTKPHNAKLLSQLALLLQEQGDTKQARELAEKAIELRPNKPYGYAAWATLLVPGMERWKALKDAIERCGDEHIWPRIGLQMRLLLEPRRHETTSVGKASPRHPQRRGLSTTETTLYNQLCEDLIAAYADQSIDNLLVAERDVQLGQFLRKKQPPSIYQPKARFHFQRSLCHAPNHAMAHFWLATLDTSHRITTCPPDYVMGLYGSTFADQFDDLLVHSLAYQTPQQLCNLLRSRRYHRALDLGCGTGLSGVALRPLCVHLEGVDVSPHMLQKARERGIYEELHEGDILECGSSSCEEWDLVVACDVLVYVGDLGPVMRQVSHSLLRVGGVFAYSTEQCSNDTDDYVLQACARFAHSEAYLRRLAVEWGFTVLEFCESVIRQNQGRDVRGYLVVLEKKQ